MTSPRSPSVCEMASYGTIISFEYPNAHNTMSNLVVQQKANPIKYINAGVHMSSVSILSSTFIYALISRN